jgi:hypothetical protein
MFIYLLDTSSVCSGPVELPVVPGLGAQLPGNALSLETELPLPPEGYVWVYRDQKLEQIVDRRGTAYDTSTGKDQAWNEVGELPEGLTHLPWPGVHHVWKDGAWLLDSEAQAVAAIDRVLGERDGLLYEAGLRIAPLQDAVDLGTTTEAEQAALLEWKAYRVDLNRIEDQPGFPSEIDWPAQPESMRHPRAAR